MNLRDVYDEGGFAALRNLAEIVESNPRYLHQCAIGWRNKRPSPALAAKLIRADPRLTWEDLYASLTQQDAA